MSGWFRNLLLTVIVIGGAGGAAYWWFVLESGQPDGSYAIDMTEVRRLAGSLEGSKAETIRVEEVARFAFPATAVVAGDGWKSLAMPVYSFQLVFADGTGIIDAALNEEQGGSQLAAFDQPAYDRMAASLKSAGFIVITHEHMDHIGGIAALLSDTDLSPQLRLTKEQVEHPEKMLPVKLPEGALANYQPLVYDSMTAIAPGVVLIRAAGHTPGSQLIYVQRADGREFLFLGDVAWAMRNVEIVRTRARLVSQFFLQEDRSAVLAQLKALNALIAAEPSLIMVAGHDSGNVGALLAAGELRMGHQ